MLRPSILATILDKIVFLLFICFLKPSRGAVVDEEPDVDESSPTSASFLRGTPRKLREISIDIPHSLHHIDWVGLAIAIVALWIVICCLCNILQCLLGCCCQPRRMGYRPVGNARPVYYETSYKPPPAHNPEYISPRAPRYTRPRDNNTCRNLLLAACCFECCCRDNQDVDCCEICCGLCLYDMCCRE